MYFDKRIILLKKRGQQKDNTTLFYTNVKMVNI